MTIQHGIFSGNGDVWRQIFSFLPPSDQWELDSFNRNIRNILGGDNRGTVAKIHLHHPLGRYILDRSSAAQTASATRKLKAIVRLVRTTPVNLNPETIWTLLNRTDMNRIFLSAIPLQDQGLIQSFDLSLLDENTLAQALLLAAERRNCNLLGKIANLPNSQERFARDIPQALSRAFRRRHLEVAALLHKHWQAIFPTDVIETIDDPAILRDLFSWESARNCQDEILFDAIWKSYQLEKLEPYGFMILILLMITGALGSILVFPYAATRHFIVSIFGL